MTPEQRRRWEELGPWWTRWVIDGEAVGGNWSDDGVRVQQFLTRFGLHPNRVLELSCLEGAHTVLLARAVTGSVCALEGRPANVNRTRFVLDAFGIRNADVVLTDLEADELDCRGAFDAIFCVGLLYHLRRPWRLLEACVRTSPRLFLWTHYTASTADVYEGRHGRWYTEGDSPTCGLSPCSFWLTRGALLGELSSLGYAVEVVAEDVSHPTGPCITLACEVL